MPETSLIPALPGLKIIKGTATSAVISGNGVWDYTTSYTVSPGNGLPIALIVDSITAGGLLVSWTLGNTVTNPNTITLGFYQVSGGNAAITITFHLYVLPMI